MTRDRSVGLLLLLFAVAVVFWLLMPYLQGKRAVALGLALLGTVGIGIGGLIQLRDFRDGFVRFGPGLQWRVARAEKPTLFYAITGLTIIAVPLLLLMLAMLWSVAIWGPK